MDRKISEHTGEPLEVQFVFQADQCVDSEV